MGLLLGGKSAGEGGYGDPASSCIDPAAMGGVFYAGGGSKGTTGHFGLCLDLFVPLTHPIGLLQAN